MRSHYEKYRESIIKSTKKYNKKNRDRILKNLKDRYVNDPDYRRSKIMLATKNYYIKKERKSKQMAEPLKELLNHTKYKKTRMRFFEIMLMDPLFKTAYMNAKLIL